MSFVRHRSYFFLLPVLLNFVPTSFGCIEKASDNQPLFLTPYIENGQIADAQKLANVTPPMVEGLESFSGYLTVNKTYNSNLFFWFLKSQSGDWEKRPLLVWIQGGPGESSLTGMLDEIGPFFVHFRENAKNGQSNSWNRDFELIRREYFWNKKYNVLFVDHPVGCGYSYTDNDSGYSTNPAEGARDLFEALQQFYQLFPDLQGGQLYIVGESYGAKFAVATAHRILEMDRTVVPVPAGLIAWSGFVDSISMSRHGPLLYSVGLLDRQQLQEFEFREEEQRNQIRAGNYKEAWGIFAAQMKRISELTGFEHVGDMTHENLGSGTDTPTFQFLNRTDVKKAIHVGNKTFSTGDEVVAHLQDDLMQSMKPVFEELLTAKAFPIIYFGGQFDIIGGYIMNEDFFNSMKWPYDEEYRKAKRCQFRVENRVAAYYKTAGTFTEVLIRNTGHLIASVQPQWAFELVDAFIQNKTSLECPYSLIANP